MWPVIIAGIVKDVVLPVARQLIEAKAEKGEPAQVKAEEVAAAVSAQVEAGLAAKADELAKPWWQSKAIIGGVASILAGLAMIAGLSSADANEAAQYAVAIVSAIGGILAIWGRLAAKRPLR